MNEHIAAYIADLNKQFQTGNAREHAYRPALKSLIEHLLPNAYTVINEPRHIECGAPDFMLMHTIGTRSSSPASTLPVAFAEAKDLDDPDLEGKTKNKEQFNRYKQSLNSLFFTDYLRFLFYYEGELITAIRLAKISDGKIIPAWDTGGSPANGSKVLPLQEADTETHFIQTLREWASAKPQLITTSKRLAERMATKAQLLAHTIEQSLLDDKKNDNQTTPLWLQLNSFKQALVSDLDEHKFADLYAQTIAYGLFAARLNTGEGNSPSILEGVPNGRGRNFTRHEAATLIPKTNPFLRDAFQHIAGYNIDKRIAWIVDDLVETFAATNMKKVMRGFKQETRQTDPILHFYEDFLRAYDPKQKKSAGVYYTPEPVVDFIVRAVDDILKTDFNLPKGLADTTKTDVQFRREENGKMVLHTENVHRVQILDPATGTGTFLAAVVRHIKASMQGQMGAWDKYVVGHLLPRLYGFELMMAPYTIAHLKLNVEMSGSADGSSANSSEGILSLTSDSHTSDDDRLRIYLTNSLERNSIIEKTALGSIIAKEANEANLIKHNAPIMIVMGNPPYSVSSNNKSEFIQDLVEDYKKGLNEKNIQPLSDDYIKFIRLAQHYVERNGEGIVAYISNNSFIDGLIHRQMRQELMRVFDKIYILDLHGNTRKKETTPDVNKDENVFDIMQGVSINIFVKHKNTDEKSVAQVYHYSLQGTRKEKYAFLLANSLKSVEWQLLAPSKPQYFFVPKDFSLQEEYNKCFKIDELMKVNVSGIKTQRDDASIFMTESECKRMKDDFLTLSVDALKQKYGFTDVRDWQVAAAKEDLQKNPILANKILYRPFDVRPMLYTGKTKGIQGYPRYDKMRHLLKPNICLAVPRQTSQDWRHVFVSDKLLNYNFLAVGGQNGASTNFPLYLYPEPEFGIEQPRIPNLNTSIWETIENWVQFGSAFAPSTSTENAGLLDFDKPEHQHTLTPEHIFDYIYGVLHSPAYRAKYKEFLKVDFPRIPYPKNADNFEHFRHYGEQLRLLHLMDEKTMLSLEDKYHDIATFPQSGSMVVEQVAWDAENSSPKLGEVPERRRSVSNTSICDPLLPSNNTPPSLRATPSNLEGECHAADYTAGEPPASQVRINASQYFANVPREAWEMYIGGYQPAQKWLKDRKGRELTFDDIQHYRRIIMILQETSSIMNRIDFQQ